MSRTNKEQPPAPDSRKKAGAERGPGGRFVKGKSGNPGGRAAKDPAIKAFCQRLSLPGIERLAAMLNDPSIKANEATNIVRLFLEYGFGRPAAELDHERLAIERGRLDLERQRVEAAAADGSAAIEVIMSDQAKEWGK